VSETKHTPGPWSVAQDKGPPYITAGPNWPRIATIVDDTPEGRANLWLIAAAPELLAACRDLDELLFRLLASPLHLAVRYGPDFEPPDDIEVNRRIDAAAAAIAKAETP